MFKSSRDIIRAALVPIALLSLCVIMFGLALVITSYVEANTLQELNYEAKVVNGTCYVRYGDRWINCKVVTENMFEVNHGTN